MIGNAHLQYQPNIFDGDLKTLFSRQDIVSRRYVKECDPETDVTLSDYPQWQHERGFWIGEYTFLRGDGTPFNSSSWNYPYDLYKGFITGDIKG